jgi:hypothetical protein
MSSGSISMAYALKSMASAAYSFHAEEVERKQKSIFFELAFLQ